MSTAAGTSIDQGDSEVVACNTCGSPDAAPLFAGSDHLSGDRFAVVRCRRCGLSYVTPRPTVAAISRYYASAYYGKRHAFAAGFFMRLRRAKLGRERAHLLDIGCGAGDFMLSCQRQGWIVAGVEQRESPIMAQQEALGIKLYEPTELGSIPAASFDVVTIWHVLEHLPDPAATMADVHRVLKPNGLVLIEVPNFGSWQGRLGRANWFHLDVPRHLYHFDRASLTQLLTTHGLEPQKWQTFSLEYDTFGLVQTLLNRVCQQPNHLFQLLIGNVPARPSKRRDTAISLALAPPLTIAALPASLVAAACGAGGVLRVWARKV